MRGRGSVEKKEEFEEELEGKDREVAVVVMIKEEARTTSLVLGLLVRVAVWLRGLRGCISARVRGCMGAWMCGCWGAILNMYIES